MATSERETTQQEAVAERDEPRETGRLEAFSDGVFAIAVTLLVLEIKRPEETPSLLPNGKLLAALVQQWPFYLAYVLGFITILIMWMNHHALVRLIRRVDRVFFLLNGILLLVVTFINYPIEILANNLREGNAHDAVIFYNGVGVLLALAFCAVWAYAAAGRRLLDRSMSQHLADEITLQYLFGPVLYLLALGLAFVWWEGGLALNFALSVFFALSGAANPLKPLAERTLAVLQGRRAGQAQ